MVLIWLLSGAMGYLFNEELLWQRICSNLGYPHLGWLVFRNAQALGFFVTGCIGAAAKAYTLSRTLELLIPEYRYVAIFLYIAGNILAAKRSGGLFYTPWLALWGLGLATTPALFQIPCTALCVVGLLSRNFTHAVTVAILAGLLTVCFCVTGYELLLLIGTSSLALFFSDRLAPIQAILIRYMGKQT